MTIRYKLRLAAALLAVSLATAGCIHVPNPFHRAPGAVKHKYTGKGERIPLAAYNETLHAADALKGQDFYLPPPVTMTDWPLPGGTPEQSVPHVDAGHDFAIAWRHSFGRASGRAWHVTAPPIVADGRIYVMDGAADVSAFDAKDGRELWRDDVAAVAKTKRDREGFGGGLAYDQGKVFVTSGYRFVAALDAGTGKVIWRQATDSPVHAAPTVAAGRVLAESTDDNLLTFDETTGMPGWSYQALTEPARILAATSPAVSGDRGLLRLGRVGGAAGRQRQQPVDRGAFEVQPQQRLVRDPRHPWASRDLQGRCLCGQPLGGVHLHRAAHRQRALEPAGDLGQLAVGGGRRGLCRRYRR